MKRALTKYVMLCLLLITIITLLPVFSFAKSENIQMIKKNENEYMIYISSLLNEEFQFAFSNDATVDKSTLVDFRDSAVDKIENGNHIAYVDVDLYTQYFKDKDNTFLWVKQGENYILKAEKVELSKALSEDEIQSFNSITKKIDVKIGKKELPKQTVNGVEISHNIGTINITDNQNATYSYKIVKATENSKAKRLIELANEINSLNNANIFEQLSVYNRFKEVYLNIIPNKNDKKWTEVNDYTIEQSQESKEGDQYIVWIKQETEEKSVIDVQIMLCDEDYIPEYEKQEKVIKETVKLPITGDNLALFVFAGVILVLIIAVVILKVRNKKRLNR